MLRFLVQMRKYRDADNRIEFTSFEWKWSVGLCFCGPHVRKIPVNPVHKAFVYVAPRDFARMPLEHARKSPATASKIENTSKVSQRLGTGTLHGPVYGRSMKCKTGL